MPRKYRFYLAPVILLVLAAGCTDDPEAMRAPTISQLIRPPNTRDEEEIFGSVYVNGSKLTQNGYYIMLQPSTGTRAKISSLGYSDYDSVMAVRPQGHLSNQLWMWGWFDIQSNQRGCAGEPYEVHWRNFTSVDTIGTHERHCVTAGVYTISLYYGSPEAGGALVRQFDVNYVRGFPTADILYEDSSGRQISPGSMHVRNTNSGSTIDAMEAGPETTHHGYNDLIIPIDIGVNAAASYAILDTVLRIDNIGPTIDHSDTVFVDTSYPSGNFADYFRFDASGTTYDGGDLGARVSPLGRLWYNRGNSDVRTEFYDFHPDGGMLRTHTYGRDLNDGSTPGDRMVKLEILNPGAQPSSLPDSVVRSIYVGGGGTVGTRACYSFEGTPSVWRYTDVIFDGSCSEGDGGGAYRWRFDAGGSFTNWSSNPVYNFGGWNAAGSKTVTLEMRTAANDVYTTNLPFYVSDSTITLSGSEYVRDKAGYLYQSSVAADWYEKFSGQDWDQNHWGDGLDTLRRVWAAGEYTVQLRQQMLDSVTNQFARGNLTVEVCYQCPLQQRVVGGAEEPTPLRLSTFGGGPVVTVDGHVTAYYDLTGASTPGSHFADRNWLSGDRSLDWGTSRLEGVGDMEWTVSRPNDSAVSLDLAVLETRGHSISLGFAWDPDLGVNPADDRSAYSDDLRMVYSYDGGAAVGLIIQADGVPQDLRVRQYGARRLAPTSKAGLLAALQNPGVDLLGGTDDVQFILSIGQIDADKHYVVRLLRAKDIRSLRALAGVAK